MKKLFCVVATLASIAAFSASAANVDQRHDNRQDARQNAAGTGNVDERHDNRQDARQNAAGTGNVDERHNNRQDARQAGAPGTAKGKKHRAN